MLTPVEATDPQHHLSIGFRPLTQAEADHLTALVGRALQDAVGRVVSLEVLREGDLLLEVRLLVHGLVASEVNHG